MRARLLVYLLITGVTLQLIHVGSVFAYDPTPARVAGRRLLVNGSAFTIRGVGYAPVPICEHPASLPLGDYFTSDYSTIYQRDLPLLRSMGANTLRLWGWNNAADHSDFMDEAYNSGIQPIYIIVTFWMGPITYGDLCHDATRERAKTDFREMVSVAKTHPAVLMWSIGNELNADWQYGGQLECLFSLVNEMALKAHEEEGAAYHPVTTPLLAHDLVNTIQQYDSGVAALDIWSANVYSGMSFGTIFSDYEGASSKPFAILEYGIDAYDDVNGHEYGDTQATYAEYLWTEIEENAAVCVGGSIMAYSDEW